MSLKATGMNLVSPLPKDQVRLVRNRARYRQSLRSALAHELYWLRHKSKLHEQMPLLDPSPYYWLFILGVNNSGTTLLRKMLKSHPLIRSMPEEGQHLTNVLNGALTRGELDRLWTRRLDLFRWTEEHDPEPATKTQYDWSFYVPDRPGIIVEKSPPNTLRARWLQKYFKPNRFIALVRHPFAVVEGIQRRTHHSIEEAARHWTLANEYLLEDKKKLEHALLIHYEALCDAPEAHLEKLEQFLGLGTPFERNILRHQFSVHNAENKPQTLQNMNAKSVARLSETDKTTILKTAGAVMEQFGYNETNYSGPTAYHEPLTWTL